MKIAFTGLELPEGKLKYNDPIFIDLVKKFQPVKTSPFYFEFISEHFDSARAIAVSKDHILDLLILDMEKIESRLYKVEDAYEKHTLEKCLEHLEEQKPLCDFSADCKERVIIKALGLLSSKPVVVFDEISPDPDIVIRNIMENAGMMFFYTVGKQEVHAWLVEKGTDAVTCAGKIHSDLARGFIKAELVSCEHMMRAHNMHDVRTKGLSRLVDRNYTIPERSILDIRFNV